MRGLPKELAEQVGGFLIMAGRLIEEDPEQAYAFAEAARRRAARLPIVREAAAETAYAAGKYEIALAEFRAIRRMSGNHDVLPAMADCERALGKPQAALKLSKEAKELPLEPAQKIEMLIVEAGARRDLGQDAEAARLLRAALDSLPPTERTRTAIARLRYAYADVLADRGDEALARDWFAAAAELDREQLTDAAERRDALDGVVIDFDLSEPDFDADEESESSSESDADLDLEVELESDVDREADPDDRSEVGLESGVDPDSEVELDAAAEVEPDADHESDADRDPAAEGDSDADVESAADQDADVEPHSAAENEGDAELSDEGREDGDEERPDGR